MCTLMTLRIDACAVLRSAPFEGDSADEFQETTEECPNERPVGADAWDIDSFFRRGPRSPAADQRVLGKEAAPDATIISGALRVRASGAIWKAATRVTLATLGRRTKGGRGTGAGPAASLAGIESRRMSG